MVNEYGKAGESGSRRSAEMENGWSEAMEIAQNGRASE